MKLNFNKLLTIFLILLLCLGAFFWYKLYQSQNASKKDQDEEKAIDTNIYQSYKWIEDADISLAQLDHGDSSPKLAKVGFEYIFQTDLEYLPRKADASAKDNKANLDKLIKQSQIIQTAAWHNLIDLDPKIFNNPFKDQQGRQLTLQKSLKELLDYYLNDARPLELLVIPYSDGKQSEYGTRQESLAQIESLRSLIEAKKLSIMKARNVVSFKINYYQLDPYTCSKIPDTKKPEEFLRFCQYYHLAKDYEVSRVFDLEDQYKIEKNKTVPVLVIAQNPVENETLRSIEVNLYEDRTIEELMDLYERITKDTLASDYQNSIQVEYYKFN